MCAATTAIVEPAHAHVSLSFSDLFIGLLIVAVVPAAFWTGIVWLIALLLGYAPTGGSLAALALGIATPSICVWSALAARE